MKLAVYSKKGQVSEVTLPAVVAGEPLRNRTMFQKVLAELSNARQAIAHTKTRGAVRGGGRKPWRQKGTGRARHGSTRSPIWVGGGITFGPLKERSFTRLMPRQMRQKALRSVLALRLREHDVFVLEDWEGLTKTKHIAELLAMMGIQDRSTLLILEEPKPDVIFASRNIQGLTLATTGSVRVHQLLGASAILTSRRGLERLLERTFQTSLAARTVEPTTKKPAKERISKKSATT